MSRLKVEIELDNDAFGDPNELVQILEDLTEAVSLKTPGPGWSCALGDSNGNTVGYAKVIK